VVQFGWQATTPFMPTTRRITLPTAGVSRSTGIYITHPSQCRRLVFGWHLNQEALITAAPRDIIHGVRCQALPHHNLLIAALPLHTSPAGCRPSLKHRLHKQAEGHPLPTLQRPKKQIYIMMPRTAPIAVLRFPVLARASLGLRHI
jgi:hypothetical protein